ncbi:MAG: DeoR family transcriptional regulator [bacterium]|nr:DeoR family transcriptional regulator [bacterium]
MGNQVLVNISVDKVKRLTLLLQKVLELLDEHEPLRTDISRESVSFFSHVSLASKGTLPASQKALLESLEKICNYLELAEHLPAFKDISIDILKSLYVGISRRLAEDVPMVEAEEKNPASPRFQTVSRRDGQGQHEEKILHKQAGRSSFFQKSRKTNLILDKPEKHLAPSPLSDRQQFMLRFASSRKKFQLKELISHFPSLSEKTIRNDLLALCEHGLVRRFGIAPRSYYEVSVHAEVSMHNTEHVFNHAESVVFNTEPIQVI